MDEAQGHGGEDRLPDGAEPFGSVALIEPTPPAEPGEPARPKRGVFTLEGRAAPGVYAASWFLTIVGVAVVIVVRAGNLHGLLPLVVAEASVIAIALGLLAGAGSQALQRRADGVRGYAGPSPFLVFVAMFACLFAVQLPLSLVFDAAGIKTDTPLFAFIDLLIYLALYAGLVQLLVVGSGALSWSEIVHPHGLYGDRPEAPVPAIANDYWPGWQTQKARPTAFQDVMLGVGLALPMVLLTGWFGLLLYQVLGLKPSDITDPLPNATTAVDRLLVFVTAALVAPLGEEIFFRGYATNAWARRMPVLRAIMRAALFFAFVHILGVTVDHNDAWLALRVAAVAFLVRVPVALALCWVYLRRRSLWASLSLHATYNGLLELIAFLLVSG